MPAAIEFTYDDCEFETADGITLCGPWLSIEIESDGEKFTVESVRSQGFPEQGIKPAPAPAYVCDFIKQWAKDDAAKPEAKSRLRKAYTDQFHDAAERAADDYADWARDQRILIAAE